MRFVAISKLHEHFLMFLRSFPTFLEGVSTSGRVLTNSGKNFHFDVSAFVKKHSNAHLESLTTRTRSPTLCNNIQVLENLLTFIRARKT